MLSRLYFSIPLLAGSLLIPGSEAAPSDGHNEDELVRWLRGDGEATELQGEFSLEGCLRLALEHNHKRPASRFSVAIARAQHRQALSAYWPQVSLNALAEIRSEAPTFIYPETTFTLPDMALGIPELTIPVPASTIQTPAGSITLPANAFGPGFPATPVAIPVPSQSVEIPGGAFTLPAQEFSVPGQALTVPEQEIQLADRATYGALVNLRWLLFDGGKRHSMNLQAKQGIAAAREDARRTDLEIINDVARMYHGTVLANQLVSLGRETLERMDATLALTEKLYQGGSLQVKKTDYLRSKVMVEGLRMLLVRLEKNANLAQSALNHSMGLSWRSSVTPADQSISFKTFNRNLSECIGEAFNTSPDWNKLKIGIIAADAKVREERSHFFPKVGLLGNAHHIENDFNTGAATDANLQSWSVGIGMEIPLFGLLLLATVLLALS